MSNIHLVLQGKGGCGKSFTSSLLAQYFMSQEIPTINIDTDPVNHSFSAIKALNAKPFPLMENGLIKQVLLDQLIEEILATENSTFIIDNGASSFIPVVDYLIDTGAVEVLNEAGHQIYIHPILAAGSHFDPTLQGFVTLCEGFANSKFIVWINEHFGEFRFDGKTFDKSYVFKKFEDQIQAVITLPKISAEKYGDDVSRLLEDKLTFEEARQDPNRPIMVRSRIHRVGQMYFTMMSQAQIG